MTTRRPLAVVNGVVSEVPVGDQLASDLVPSSSLGTFDGGNATTDYTGVAQIDCGGAA